MKGAIGFLVGIIGVSVFASMSILIRATMRGPERDMLFLIVLGVAFIFLNILVVGFYRMLGHLHETVLYPDDSHYRPLRGRALFFVGYVGLLVTLIFVILVDLVPQMLRFRINPGELQPLMWLAWFGGWVFFGLLMGSILMQLSDIYHKALYRTMVSPPGDEDLDIARRGSRRNSRSGDDDEERPRRWDDE